MKEAEDSDSGTVLRMRNHQGPSLILDSSSASLPKQWVPSESWEFAVLASSLDDFDARGPMTTLITLAKAN